MTRMQRILDLLLVLWLVSACTDAAGEPVPLTTMQSPQPTQALRLMWVNSYNANDNWALSIQAGISETLASSGYSLAQGNLVWETVAMDAAQYTLSYNLLPLADTVIVKIQAFQPDVVIVSDDQAIRSIIPRYPDPNQPFVFCGLDVEPQDYDLLRPNVTGVLEALHPLQTLEIARAFVGEDTDYMLLSDGSAAGQLNALRVYDVLEAHDANSSPASFWVVENWAVWQDVVLKAAEVDFIMLVSSGFVWDNQGGYVEQEALMAWMLEHSPVPIFAMSDQAVVQGAVAGLVPSGYDQGAMAGKIVVRIARGTHPTAIRASTPSRNLLVMNLAAARHWNLPIPVAFPLAAHVYRSLPESQGGQ